MTSISQFRFDETKQRGEYYNSVLDYLLRSQDITDESLCYILEQVETSSPGDDEITYHTCKLISTIFTVILARLLKNGYVKLQVKLVHLTEKYVVALDTSKLNSKNVYSKQKKLAVICLNAIMAKFGGFLNSFKSNLLTYCYKHVKKLTDASTIVDSSYLNAWLLLVNTLLNSNPNLDHKIFQRLLKLQKLICSKNKTYSAENDLFDYSILSVVQANNILTTLLTSPFYINSITSKKSSQNPLHHLNSISSHLSYFISILETGSKHLRLSTAKNISTILSFSYVNYGADEHESTVFNFIFNFLWSHYLQYQNKKVRVGLLEALVQFMSTSNLIFEAGLINNNSKNFISLKSFEIISITLDNVFNAEDGITTSNASIDFNAICSVLNHLDFFYSRLLREVKSDVNKLIILQYIYDDLIDLKDAENSFKLISILRLSQLIIMDIDQFILTHETTKMEHVLLELSTNKNPYLRVLSIQTLSKLNVNADRLVSQTHRALDQLFNERAPEERDTFIISHSNSLLIASIISTSNSVSMDSILTILALASSVLKKYNSNVIVNNLMNGNDLSSLSNTSYEKQVASWILMSGLLNYYKNSQNPFLMSNNQLLGIWKSLLAHNVPQVFLKVESGRITHANELTKFLEIKNYALSCLICFIDYAISLNSMPSDFAKQLTPLLTKSYSFVTSIEQTLAQVPGAHEQLFKTIQLQKLRILTNFVKILVHLIKLTDGVNISSDMLIHIVSNFSNQKLYNCKATETPRSTYDLYRTEDGYAFGLTSKLNLFQIDELLFKQDNVSSGAKNDIDVDTVPNSSNFLIESRQLKSNLSAISDLDVLERSLLQPIQSSIMNDYLFSLISNGKSYSNTKVESVPVETAVVDLSIELFQLVFPYLSLKIQQSVLEHIRSSMLATDVAQDNLQDSALNEERHKAIIANASLAIHGMLHHASTKEQHLKLSRMIVNLVLETLKRVETEDLLIIDMNAESVGLSLSVLEENPIKLVSETSEYFVNKIVEDTKPWSRAFSCLALSNIFRHNTRACNSSTIINVLFKLVLDPHPVVHHWCFQSLIIVFESFANYSGAQQLFTELFTLLNKIYIGDEFGIHTLSRISSNLNLSFEGSDKNVLLIKCIRVVIKILGPGVKSLTDKDVLRNLISQILLLTTTNFDLVAREMTGLFDELNIFDKNLIDESVYGHFLRFIYTSDVKLGVYNDTLTSLPLLDDVIHSKHVDNEIFSINSSEQLLALSVNSLHQVAKVTTSASSLHDLLNDKLQGIIWMLLESNNAQVFEIFKLWLDLDFTSGATKDQQAKKMLWFDELIKRHDCTEKQLYGPLNAVFKQKLIANASLFISKLKNVSSTGGTKTVAEESKSFTNKRKSEDDNNRSGDDESIGSEEGNAMTSVADEETSGRPEADESEKDADNSNIVGAKAQKISDEEPVRWQFKLRILELLIQLISYAETDDVFLKYLSTRLSDLVRVSFIASTSQISKLRYTGLKLLGVIMQSFASMRDPMYDNLSILDQQQAQIISAILPAFSKNSTVELVCEGFEAASILISSNITSLARLQRLIKILVVSLHDYSLLKANKKTDSTLKIGDAEVNFAKDQDRIGLAILNAWANLKIHCQSEELHELINENLRILTSLWVYSLKQYSLAKYGDMYTEVEDVSIDVLGDYWQQMITAISLVIRDDTELIDAVVGPELNNFFFTVFAQCIEILFKRNATSKTGDVLNVLKNLLSLKSSASIVYHDLIFEEIVDLFDKLLVNLDNEGKLVLIDIISELYVSYFDNKLSSGKQETDIHDDVDKLFELLRLNVSLVIQVLPFIKDRRIAFDKIKSFEELDLQIVREAMSKLLLMIDRLPLVIRLDLQSCVLYMFSFIYEFDNGDLISMILPHLKKILAELASNQEFSTIRKFFNAIKVFMRDNNSINSLFTYLVFTSLVSSEPLLSEQDSSHITTLLLHCLQQEDTAAISARSIKTLMIQNTENVNGGLVLKSLIPALVEYMIDNRFQEPRIVIELLAIFVKNSKEPVLSLSLFVPILLWYSGEDPKYANAKLLDLIQFAPDHFKFYISEVSEDEKHRIEQLVKYHDHAHAHSSTGNQDTMSQHQHINLKVFGAEASSE